MRFKSGGCFAVLFALLVVAPRVGWSDTTGAPCDVSAKQRIPARLPAAMSATAFLRRVANVSEDERENVIRDEILAGNIPSFLRGLMPVAIPAGVAHGSTVTVCVLPDYLSVGSNRDFVITPMRLKTALTIATQYGFMLPTTTIVDAIYRQAGTRLRPLPLPPGEQMRSTAYLSRHNAMTFAQREALHEPLGMLTAGHKKDLVITNRLWDNPARVAIYGWHRADGRPIQPLSTVHGERYADYSHGVRLVSDVAYVDGKARSLADLLQDPQWARALSNEGPIRRATQLVKTLAQRPVRPSPPS